MTWWENECVSCAVPCYPCMGLACPNRNVKHIACDDCKDEDKTIYEYEGEELCIDCIKSRLTVVE